MNLVARIKTFNLAWVITALIISVTWVNFNLERWRLKDVIKHDINSYYAYLPATFIEGDLGLTFLKDRVYQHKHYYHYAPTVAPNGNFVIKTPMGMALSYLPFFAIAHAAAKLCGFEADGFSEPYHFAILFSSLFYFIIGLLYLNSVLRLYFPGFVSTLTVFCLCFGTHIFFYLTEAGGLAHTVGFALSAAFLYHTINWHQLPGKSTAVKLGLITGLLILVRPVNALLLLLFFLYEVKDLGSLKEKVKLLGGHLGDLVVLFVILLLICLPQLIYWKCITGSWVYNSYNEHFYFGRPHLVEGLFGARKGWLVYTPLMALSVAGLFMLKQSSRAFAAALPVFFCVYAYVVFSWWCWWYGGSFGMRALIDVYPLLAVALASLIYHVRRKSTLLTRIMYVVIGLFIALNLFQSMQVKYNIIHYDSMTWSAYREVFFKTSKQGDREKYLDHPDYERARRGEPE